MELWWSSVEADGCQPDTFMLGGHHRTEDYHQSGYENHPTHYYFLRKEDGVEDTRGTDA
jgi:hypothetical protein